MTFRTPNSCAGGAAGHEGDESPPCRNRAHGIMLPSEGVFVGNVANVEMLPVPIPIANERNTTMSNDIVLFEAKDGSLAMPVQVKAETVWLSLLQMAQLFEKDKTVIFRHVKNAIADGEIDPKVTIANFAMVTPHGAIPGKTRVQNVDCYNLDVIISVGYRVHSPRGVEFRRWATRVLKEYIVRGYALNRERLKQLGQAA